MSQVLFDPDHIQELVAASGYRNDGSLMLLRNLVVLYQSELVVELGTYLGCSAIYMAAGGSRVITIDDYQACSVEVVLANIAKYGAADMVTLAGGSTFEAGELVKKHTDKLADLIFMDASHTLVDLHKEYASIIAVAAKDHILVVDDVSEHEVMRFVTDVMWQYPVVSMYPQVHNGVAILWAQSPSRMHRLN